MTKVEQPKAPLSKPSKPVSRLGELAATRVVTAGQAFERDLGQRQTASLPASQQPESAQSSGISAKPREARSSPQFSIKRTFRYPKGLDTRLKKLLHQYNLEKPENERELTMEEIGVLMAEHFLSSEAARLIRDSRAG